MKDAGSDPIKKNDNKSEEDILTINLNESSNAREFEGNNIIHKIEYSRAISLIRKQIQNAQFANKNNVRYNDTISILGSRGSGKTSFLLSLLKDKNITSDAIVLKIIDPTLIEEKGHIFLTIISLIKEIVYDKLRFNECIPGDQSYPKMREWKTLMHKLADGLPSIDGVGVGLNEIDWKDAEFIMDRGLESVKAATYLENNFNKLVNESLKVLGKSAFVITLDDIDVDFRKGWPVLETIRKYLTSPQIIVLLSGDLKLYSKAIRKRQWGNFGKELLINEGERLEKMNHYNDLVTEMESQYLQKVIKPENRIHLTTLFEKVTTYKVKIKIIKKEPDTEVVSDEWIKDYYDTVLENFGIRNPYQAEAYRSFLMSLPLRTQIQFLTGYNDPSSNIADAFLSDLYEKEVDIQLAQNLPKMFNITVIKLLLRERILAEAYQLQPITTDISLNSSLTALSFLFCRHVKSNPYLIFDYFINIGYVKNLLDDIKYKETKGDGQTMPYSIDDLCRSSGVYQDKVLRDIAGNITSYVRGVINYPKLNSTKCYAGTIPLTGLAIRAKKENEFRIDEEFKTDPDGFRIASIPLSISSSNWKNSTILTSSIFVLISAIGEFIKVYYADGKSVIQNDDDEISRKDIMIANTLIELSQIRTYVMPNFNRQDVKFEDNEENEEDDSDLTIDEKKEVNEKIITQAKIIRKWIERFPETQIAISPHLLGKISTRFYFALDSIERKQRINNLGNLFYRIIIAFVNSVIIEEIKEISKTDIKRENFRKALTSKDLILDNTITDNRIFKKNLKVAMTYKENLFLSQWILSCPLLLMYLPKNESIIENYKNFIVDKSKFKQSEFDEIMSFSIFATLERVAIRGFENEFGNKGEASINNNNQVTSQAPNNPNLPKFSLSKKNIAQTIAIVSQIFSVRDFENLPLEVLNERCSKYFSDKIDNRVINNLKNKIIEKQIRW